MIRVHIFISGKVQGVLFRDSMRRKAQKLGLSGWVQNLKNGKVEAVAEGEKDKIEELISWVKRGPILAKVNNIEIEWEEYRGEFRDFNILY